MSTKSEITKPFGKTSNLFFSEKRKFTSKITFEDSEEDIISDDTLVSEELNNLFQNATVTLNVNENSYIVNSSCSNITAPVDKDITYKNYSSILLMKQELENMDHFSFKEVSISEMEKEWRGLNSN